MIRPCPLCLGKMDVRPLDQKYIRKCTMCDGLGKVNTENTCECGRPAVVLIGDTLVCTTKACQEKAVKAPVDTSKVSVDHHYLMGFYHGGAI